MTFWRQILVIPISIAILTSITDFCCHEKCQQSQNPANPPIQTTLDLQPIQSITNRRPKYWFHHADGPQFHFAFQSIDRVLSQLNLQKLSMNLTYMHSDWDLVWSYHFHDLQYLPFSWSKLKFHQKINHIPGNHHLTSKSVFGTQTDSQYVPRAFTNVEKLRTYAAEHPDKLFVLKRKSNRGVELRKVSDMDFKESSNVDDYFAQEFIDRPLLFDGHKFDFGVYVLVTSVQPLRLYYYTRNMIFRFCSKSYDISDPMDHDRYVVSDSKIPVWEFNGTKMYFEDGYNTRDAFDGFLRRIGADVGKVWEQIEDCIRSLVMMKEERFIYWTKVFKTTKQNHFELFRFDMILDSSLNLHVIEVNQHPNLYAGATFKRNRFLYENLLYNLFNLIGVGTTFAKEDLKLPSMEVEWMITAEHQSLLVSPELCMSDQCRGSCSDDCEFCKRCLISDQMYELVAAHREVMAAGEFKRLFPPAREVYEKMDDSAWKFASKESRKLAKWFNLMCEKNWRFC